MVARPAIPLSRVAAILNMDVMNLNGATRDVAAVGTRSVQSAAASSAGPQPQKVSRLPRAGMRSSDGAFFRSDHFPLGARRGTRVSRLRTGRIMWARPADYGQKKQEEYTEKRYHQPSDEVLPSFNYDGARQQLRVIVRTAVAVADASAQPAWNPSSEFRKAGEERLKAAVSLPPYGWTAIFSAA